MPILLALLLVATLGSSSEAQTTIKLSPTTITIPRGESSASIAVRNESADEVSLQVRAFRWRNVRQGDIELDPTEDLVVFPPQLILRPGETRRIRLGARQAANQVELAYRLILEQTGDEPNVAALQGAGVAVRMRFSLPVFVPPKSRNATVDVSSLKVDQGEVRLGLNNSSGLHLTPRAVTVRGLNDRGTVVWTQQFPAWYLLAGEVREYAASLTSAQCAQAVSLAAEVSFLEGNGLTLTKREPVSSGACVAR
jgi:fimbrial chaperone protein